MRLCELHVRVCPLYTIYFLVHSFCGQRTSVLREVWGFELPMVRRALNSRRLLHYDCLLSLFHLNVFDIIAASISRLSYPFAALTFIPAFPPLWNNLFT